MRTHARRWGLAVLALLALPAAAADGGTAAPPTPARVDDRLVQSRAVEAVIWGMPAADQATFPAATSMGHKKPRNAVAQS